jgi:hypothetical protein
MDGRVKPGHDDIYRPLRSFARLCGEIFFNVKKAQ